MYVLSTRSLHRICTEHHNAHQYFHEKMYQASRCSQLIISWAICFMNHDTVSVSGSAASAVFVNLPSGEHSCGDTFATKCTYKYLVGPALASATDAAFAHRQVPVNSCGVHEVWEAMDCVPKSRVFCSQKALLQ